MFEIGADRGIESVESLCLEFMTVASACQENDIAKDFFTAAFQSEMSRNYLRNNHIARAKRIFIKECSNWSDEQFVLAELLVMGIQYSTITASDNILPLKMRISGALNQILSIYNVDEQTRTAEIEKVLQMDCRQLGKRILAEFIKYVKKTNEHTLEELLQRHRRKK
uniref:hypothetical protein n=1 Tax=Agathobacter sp. TaxID=2021311 RepID=UPI004057B58B